MNAPSTSGWVRGRRSGAAWLRSRGLLYGDGVFRTILKYNNNIVDITEQFEKLVNDAHALGLRPPDPETMFRAVHACSRGRAASAVRLTLVRNPGQRGYRPSTDESQLIATADPLPDYPRRCWRAGARAFVSAIRLGEQPALAGIKHLNRLEQVLAAADWSDSADEGILCDMRGRPICGIRSNLFWVAGGSLYTPDLRRCGVAGRTRDRVLVLARKADLPVRIVCRPMASLMQADEVFVTNSLIGMWPLRAIADRSWPAPGPITRRLSAALGHPWRG